MAQERHRVAGATDTSLMLNAVSSNDADLPGRNNSVGTDQRRRHLNGSTGTGNHHLPSPPNPPVNR
jgi:hypothetical protein